MLLNAIEYPCVIDHNLSLQPLQVERHAYFHEDCVA